MKRPSTLIEVLRTLPGPLWAIGAAGVIALVAMIPQSSVAAGKSGDKKSGENSAGMHPCPPPNASPGGKGAGTGGSGTTPCYDLGRLSGEELFKQPFPGTNGRSCASCHVPEDNFTLTPAHVERVWKENPKDPLFAAIDADDPTAETLTFEHLKKGLIRIWLTLPANMDLIDEGGKVITPADRKIFVWRSVPSIADVVLTAPYQLDGREATLEQQAQGAITSHSEGGAVSRKERKRIADFERSVFSSERARWVSLGAGDEVEDWLQLTPQEQRGREVYKNVCESCHGGADKTTIVNREVHALAFPALRPDGTIRYVVPATEPQTPVYFPQPTNEFINVGSAWWNYMTQNRLSDDNPSFTKDVSFPQYRFRFYKDASKTEITADLPPIPLRVPDNDNPLAVAIDSDGNFIVGPNQFPQKYTADPGRAVITGNPYDFEAFDIPTLRGISKTAPYWHNHISATLEEVVELYSDQLLSKFPILIQPGEKEHGDGPGPEETMTRQQKDDLVAFLKRL